MATAVWMVHPAGAASGSLRERLSALPDGSAAGALGAIVFGVGGVADSVWDSVLGIEVDLAQ